LKLENVEINDVLPLKAARRDTTANLECFGTVIYHLPFGKVWLGSVKRGNETEHILCGGWLKNLVPF